MPLKLPVARSATARAAMVRSEASPAFFRSPAQAAGFQFASSDAASLALMV